MSNNLRIPTILLVFLFAVSNASDCVKEKIQYDIARFTSSYKEEIEHHDDVVIKNDKEAFYINITGPVKSFCKGSINISVRSHHFWCGVSTLKTIEVGAFDNQIIDSQFIISGNKIKVVQTGLFHDLQVELMDLIYNEIEEIQENSIVNLPQLTTLHLSHNKISNLHPNAIRNTPKLQWFDISNNNLKTLGPKVFDFLRKEVIVGIGVSGNNLEKIDPKAFEGLNIYTLGLDNNHLSTIPDTIFTNNKELSEIHLANNSLTSLSDKFFEMKTLNFIYLSGNDFKCDTILKLRDLFKRGGYVKESPKNGRFVKILSYDEKDC
ncbi:unnamed protein product [Brassicogethes aeneus]|uniref:Uncharacterized protein n=1 Tax=Brassicogethes aeneus TaxID=1431903 RepID=A0A9P0FFI5_BRAAE|nr:unnamed protein product [Brassicogethes aeneus]